MSRIACTHDAHSILIKVTRCPVTFNGEPPFLVLRLGFVLVLGLLFLCLLGAEFKQHFMTFIVHIYYVDTNEIQGFFQ